MKDKLGIIISGLCVVHCLLFALLIWGGVGSVGFLYVSEELIHPILLVCVLIVGLISFPSAYWVHKKKEPIILGSIGTIGLFFALFFSTLFEVIFTVIFGTILIIAHFWNHKLRV